MKTAIGNVALVLLLACAASADFIADGDLSEWGVTPGSDWNNDVGARQWVETWIGSQGYVGPGNGGQTFNTEGMYAISDGENLYYAIVTGHPDTGALGGDNNWYHPGDVFIDLAPFYVPSGSQTPTGTMEFAVETTSWDAQHPRGGDASLNEGAGSFYSRVSVDLAEIEWEDVYWPLSIARPGEGEAAEATLVGQTAFAYNDDFYGSEHYVIEGIIPLAWLGDLDSAEWRVMWSMTCGNDNGVLEGQFTFSEVPEPGTLCLAGSGLLVGIGGFLRRKMK